MHKKGIEANTLVWILVGVVIVIGGSFFFVKALGYFSDCKFDNIRVLGILPKQIAFMALPGQYKSTDTATFRVSCASKIYFIDDKQKQQMLDSGALDDEPLVKDAVQSGTDDTVFLMDGDKIAGSFTAPNINLDYPYHICFDLKRKNKIIILLEGLGKEGVKFTPYCSQVECTSVPEILTDIQINRLVSEICEGDAACISQEIFNIQNAQDHLNVKLKVSACHPQATKIEFLITPKEGTAAKGVKFFETVPKDCIADLRDDLTYVDGGDSDVLIKPDPMLVWDFDSIREERQVAYHISKMLGDTCRKQLKAVASAELIVKEEYWDVPIDQITKEMLDPGFITSLQIRGITVPDGNVKSIRQEHPLKFYKHGLKSGWYAIEQGSVEDSDWTSGSGNTAPQWIGTVPGFPLLNKGFAESLPDISQYATDVEEDSPSLSYVFFDGGNEVNTISRRFVNCEIKVGNSIECQADNSNIGSETFTIRVKDSKGLSDDTSFLVNVI